MEVILLEKIHKLGDLGDQVRVKAGYGRNFLIPGGKAVPANPENIAKLEARREELETAQQDAFAKAQSRAEALNGVSVTFVRKAGAEGKLYGSVGTVDIAEAVTATGVELAKNEVKLPEGPLRMAGEYNVDLHLHADVIFNIGIVIAAEED